MQITQVVSAVMHRKNQVLPLMNAGIEKISDVDLSNYSEFKKNGDYANVYTQIQYQKGNIDEKYVIVKDRIKEILENDYIAEVSALNNLSKDEIHAGQSIVVAYYTRDVK